jgi:DNA-binding MarR family transcriptional regulator
VQPTSSIEQLTGGLIDLLTYLMKTAQCDVFQSVMELDLSMSQVRTLFLVDAARLHGTHELALHELAEQLGLSVAAAGRAVDTLVRVGLTDRHEDTADRRVKRVTLTPAGQELVDRLSASHRDDTRRFAEALTEEERTRLNEALTPILTRPDIRALTIGPNS